LFGQGDAPEDEMRQEQRKGHLSVEAH